MQPVTKQVFLAAQVCLTQGWLLRNSIESAPPSEADQFRMAEGREIGRLARTLFLQGILVPGGDLPVAAERTRQLLSDPSVPAIFEGAFTTDGYVARPDILKRSATGWEVIEVKQNLEDTGQLDELIDDLTYTVMVLRRCNVHVTAASLMLLSRAYRKNLHPDRLFVPMDRTASVETRLKEFLPCWTKVQETTADQRRPVPSLIPQCKACGYFASECLGKGVADPVLMLPNLRANRIAELAAAGIVQIQQLPSDFPLTETQRRVAECTRTRTHHAAQGLRRELEQIQWPAYYLDFETVMTALPLYDDQAPHQQIVTQYSLHHCSAPGKVAGHREYLADSSKDCQRELAERLIADVDGHGSIVVYSSFEKARIGALAERFPDLVTPLHALRERLFDLLAVIRSHFYHPGFGGSYSIKAVLPALVPDMSYDQLSIGHGGIAVARFANMAMGRYSPPEAQKVRADLLQYCKQDTLATVRLHEQLLAYA